MDRDTITRMIADLEILGALEDRADSSASIEELCELGADFLLASSPRKAVPDTLHEKVLSRIVAEPPRVETDVEGRVVAINPAFSGLCGYTFQEIRGRKPGSMLQGEGTEPAQVEKIRAAVRKGENVVAEMVNYHKNGTPYRVKIQIDPLRDDSGVLTGFRAVEQKLA